MLSPICMIVTLSKYPPSQAVYTSEVCAPAPVPAPAPI